MLKKEIRLSFAKNNRGSALIIALILMAILTVAGIAGVLISRTNIFGSRSDRMSKISYNMAEEGILRAQKKIALTFKSLTDTDDTPTVLFDASKVEGSETYHNDASNPQKSYYQYSRQYQNRHYLVRYRIDNGNWQCNVIKELNTKVCQMDYTIESAILDPKRSSSVAGQTPYQEAYLRSLFSVRRMNMAQMGAFFVDDLELGADNGDGADFTFTGLVHTNGSFFAGGNPADFLLKGFLSSAGHIASFPLYDIVAGTPFYRNDRGMNVQNIDGSDNILLDHTKDAIDSFLSPEHGRNFNTYDILDPARHDGLSSDYANADTWRTDSDWISNSIGRTAFDSRLKDSSSDATEIAVPDLVPDPSGTDRPLDIYATDNVFEKTASIDIRLANPLAGTQTLMVTHPTSGLSADFSCPASGGGDCTLGSIGAGTIILPGPSLGPVVNKIFVKQPIYNGREAKDVNLLAVDFAELTNLLEMAENVIIKPQGGGEILDPNAAFASLLYIDREDAVPDCRVVCSTSPSDPICSSCDLTKTAWKDPDSNTQPNGFLFKNAESIPQSMMWVSPKPIYLHGEVNVHNSAADGRYDPYDVNEVKSDDNWKPLAIISDTIYALSDNFVLDPYDPNNMPLNNRAGVASRSNSEHNNVEVNDTKTWEINASIVAGALPSFAGDYSGGWENYIRTLEDFEYDDGGTLKRKTLTVNGNFLQLWKSRYSTSRWSNGSWNYYTAPNRDYRLEIGYNSGVLPPEFENLFGSIQAPPIIKAFISQYIISITRNQSTINFDLP